MAANQATNKPANNAILNDAVLTAKRKRLDPQLSKLVIKMAPESVQELAQLIKECTQNPNKKCPAKALFVGTPGVGKTTLAQAIAEEAGIEFIKINAAFVSNTYKD